MKVLITGINGTVGKAMNNYLKSIGVEVLGWDRNKVNIFNYSEMKCFLEKEKPDILFHFAIASKSTGIENESWKVNYEWTSELAWLTKELGIKFLFTSTAIIFSDDAIGPFTISSIPDAKIGYGYEKYMAENKIISQNKDSYIVRLGWQIGEEAFGNNMIEYFEKENRKNGINASKKWYPACSFVKDTVKELYRIVTTEKPFIYMIDSNDKYSFFDLANIINEIHGEKWNVIEDNSFVYEQRMVDFKSKIPKLSEKFKWYDLKNTWNLLNGEIFHNNENKIYLGDEINLKKDNKIIKIVYNPAHLNNEYDDYRKGIGKNYVKWIFSEEEGTKENIFKNSLELLLDSVLPPNSSIGLHKHTNNSEIYYIIEGEIEVTIYNKIREKKIILCKKGDAHIVYEGEEHYGISGDEGVRFIVVSVKV